MNYELLFRYLTNKATSEEIEKFEAWLNSSESNRALYNDWHEFWKITGKSYTDFQPDTGKRWEEVNTLIREKTDQPGVIRLMIGNWYRIAAVILLFVLLGAGSIALLKTGIINTEKYLTYASGSDTLSVQLEDGSVVSLNANSILEIPKSFNRNNRSVQLSGEAFFTIAKDPEHPFKVFSKTTVTEVLGTSFNIKSREPEVRITLLTGKVAFYKEKDTEHKLILYPGQQGIFNNSTGLFLKDTVSGLNNVAWKTKRLEFSQTPLDQLCNELSDYYKERITFSDTDNCKGSFTGIIHDISLDEAISIIELTMDVKAIQYKDSIVFSVRNNETMSSQ
ncbi:MAG: FecR domain-containing protein [Bacteroidales bacterium]|jgi:ferric-dicitrate binding protein FerR (iron transport regulator)